MSSSLSGAGERSARPRIFIPPRPRGMGPLLRLGNTELRLVMRLESIPCNVHVDEVIGRGSDGQSPMRWWLLVQCEQEIDTCTGLEDWLRSGSFHM